MPRTFSRGVKFDARKVFTIVDAYLTPDQQDLFVEEARFRYCTEAPLEEFDPSVILDALRTLRDILRGAELFLSTGLVTESIQDLGVFFVTLGQVRRGIRVANDALGQGEV